MPGAEPFGVLIAPDSFKGTFSSVVVARALAVGWARARPADAITLAPLADGGEGTIEALVASGGWDVLPATARDPLMRPLDGRFLRQGERGVVELATASGLSLLPPAERDAGAASTFGTGQILAAAVGLGCRHVVIGLGGSATTDGGSGILAALGVRFLDASGADLPPGGGALDRLARVDLSGLPAVLGEVELVVASDVTNPLLGERGAAATYGPQKGADATEVRRLDANLAVYADVMETAVGRSLRDVPGAGAAGGATFGLLAIADRFASFEVRAGVEVVMELVGFTAGLEACRLVLTGEGRVDAQTAYGKTAMGVARRAREAGRAVICFGGGVTPEGSAIMAELGAVTVPVVEAPMTIDGIRAAGTDPIERAAARVAEIVSLASGS